MSLPSQKLRQTQIARQSRNQNLQTANGKSFAGHRQQIMESIECALARLSSDRDRSITVLGAGNCNDLDLDRLCNLFGAVSLLDLDEDAVDAALVRLVPEQRSKIQVVAPVDLAAPLATITAAQWQDDGALPGICRVLLAPFDLLPTEPADLVASTCVLSQILNALAYYVPPEHPHFPALVQAIRRGHILRMLQLLKPGGEGLLITDLVSSDTVPHLLMAKGMALPAILARCLADSNFFSGLHPGIMLKEFTSSSDIAAMTEAPQMIAPWRWDLGPRAYAVYAISFRRK